MKYSITSIILLFILTLSGCITKEDVPTAPVRDFSGITERNEWGDTLSVDTTDWVFTGFVNPPGSQALSLGQSGNGVKVNHSEIAFKSDDLEYSLGVFPNPFIPGAGRLIIELSLVVESEVEIRIENPAGDQSVVLWNSALQAGLYQFTWNGSTFGAVLPEGIYRLFMEAVLVSCFGDVEVNYATQPDPPTNADFVLYADQYYDTTLHVQREYQVAAYYGSDGILSGSDVYTLPYSTWQILSYDEKFAYLPIFMNYDISSADPFQYHYLIAYKHFQFGAGWPESGHYVQDPIDTTMAQWQYQNYVHDTYLGLYVGD
ncbi:hypothetical protein CEE37_04220 [candidate division LCP-89 bacterium B3_LCP]|uniref:Uncharacterized protein n=1 Tax=candidate division LCP-89 bacterium B3_LCP TaxID=2012998 RepID=A0A532V3J0_UNCL8|nr:MAG: hypothetical protein CEE37_04220 [candidate division LCP-89 bacterium B3_LCP]